MSSKRKTQADTDASKQASQPGNVDANDSDDNNSAILSKLPAILPPKTDVDGIVVEVVASQVNEIPEQQQIAESPGKYETGNVNSSAAATATEGVDCGVLFARDPETRAQATNRWILEGCRWEVDRRRKDLIRQGVELGLTRKQAANHAWDACLAEFPPPDVEPSTVELPEPELEPEPIEPEPDPIPESAPIPTEPADQGVPGLGDIPDDWGTLPANASLQAEVSWVSANRLRVRDGSGVDLSRALSPAPSYSALSWLETSILFPSKFADISVKATQHQEDEREHVRREKLAIEEIRGLLAEMLEEDD